MSLYDINQLIEIVNHSEPACNGQLGTIVSIEYGYDGVTPFYSVLMEEQEDMYCLCTDDEIMEA